MTEIEGFAWNVFGKSPAQLNEWLLTNLDLYCLSEVNPQHLDLFPDFVGIEYDSIKGETGGSQRLQIIYSDRLKLIETRPLKSINFLRTGKDPIYALFECDGVSFWVVCVHLPRRNFLYRWIHGYLLKRFAANQEYPGAIIGDANCDLQESGHSDRVFKILTGKGGLVYANPKRFIPTHCSKHRSILDAVFYKGFTDVQVDILHSQGEYCTNGYASDHRPIQFTINTQPGETIVADSNRALRDKNQSLQDQYDKLEQEYESLLDLKTAPSPKLKYNSEPIKATKADVPSYSSGGIFQSVSSVIEPKAFTWQSVLQSIVVAFFASLAWRFANKLTFPEFSFTAIPWEQINSISAVTVDPTAASSFILKLLLALLSLVVVALTSAWVIRWVSYKLSELKDNMVVVGISIGISAVVVAALAIYFGQV
jgi:hypothetical protein